MEPAGSPTAARFLVPALALALLLAGCAAPPPVDNGETPQPHIPPRTPPDWQNPYDFPLHFDGWRAYEDLLAHIYTDPVNHTGPRYRIPGTAAHAEGAAELLAWLHEPLAAMGGSARFHNFTGVDYFALDLTPVATFLCPPGPPGSAERAARDEVRALSFSNIVGRTHSDEIGLVVGAHWDSKAHVEPLLEQTYVDPAYQNPDHRDYDPAIHAAVRPVLGADDGASGTVAVIELARAFAETGVDLPLTFILFDGEDGFDRDDCHPLAGSLHYAQNLNETERESMVGIILLDMVGNKTARYFKEAFSQCYPERECDVDSSWLLDHVWNTAAEMGVRAFENRSTGFIIDDHVPFLFEGLYGIDIIRYEDRFPPYWHTSLDDHTAVHPIGLHQVGQVVEASIRLLAQAEGAAPAAGS